MRIAPFILLGMALTASAVQAGEKLVPVDNSAINERDRSGRTLTPEDQSQSPADLKLAAAVRSAVVDRQGLSLDGQNVKIITRDNRVTLRGPVKDASERALIEKTVRGVSGTATVDNQLEIK